MALGVVLLFPVNTLYTGLNKCTKNCTACNFSTSMEETVSIKCTQKIVKLLEV